jgi:hypothetical protein
MNFKDYVKNLCNWTKNAAKKVGPAVVVGASIAASACAPAVPAHERVEVRYVVQPSYDLSVKKIEYRRVNIDGKMKGYAHVTLAQGYVDFFSRGGDFPQTPGGFVGNGEILTGNGKKLSIRIEGDIFPNRADHRLKMGSVEVFTGNRENVIRETSAPNSTYFLDSAAIAAMALEGEIFNVRANATATPKKPTATPNGRPGSVYDRIPIVK